MGAIQPPAGCMKSIESCIDDLCAEQSKSTSVIKWLQRMSESTALSQLDDNMTVDTSIDRRIGVQDRVLGSTQHGRTQWASDQRFAEAWSHKDASSEQKAQFRYKVSRDYLADNPNDCRPPSPPQPQPARRPAPTRQLSLFEPPGVTARVQHEGDIGRAWWTTTPWVVLGAATLAAEHVGGIASRLDKAIGYSLWEAWGYSGMQFFTVNYEYFYQAYKKAPVL